MKEVHEHDQLEQEGHTGELSIIGSRAQFLRPFSGQDVLMIDFTSWGHLLKI